MILGMLHMLGRRLSWDFKNRTVIKHNYTAFHLLWHLKPADHGPSDTIEPENPTAQFSSTSPEYLNPLMHRDTSHGRNTLRLITPAVCENLQDISDPPSLISSSDSDTAVKITSDLLGFQPDRFSSRGRSITCRV